MNESIRVEYTGRNLRATLERTYDDRYLLWHTDYVANDWTELFDEPAVALARVAVLIQIDQQLNDGGDGNALYSEPDTPEFEAAAREWLTARTC